MKKEYISPELEILQIVLSGDILGNSIESLASDGGGQLPTDAQDLGEL